jgi:predicted dehydrogenase
MGLKVGVLGAGAFASSFIPLFQAHPAVEEVCIAEAFPERRAEQAARFGIMRAFASQDELFASDVDAVAIFTQRWLHGPQAVAALEAGKHVYSAVPAGVTVDEIGKLVETVKRTGLTYMMGETSYYYPSTLYCRQRFQAGDFGQFVYGEAEYLHDMSHGFYEAYQHSGGTEWKKTASFPPMLYPSHSVSMIVSVTGARMTKVSCLGYVDTAKDGVFEADVSMWRNVLSNETALFRTSDGGMARINEFRRVGLHAGSSVRCSIYGTEGSYEEQSNAQVWNTRVRSEPPVDLGDLLAPKGMQVSEAELKDIPEALREEFFNGVSKVHPVERLPKEFVGHRNGHLGSHQFLVLDFIEALTEAKLPPNNVWAAARYCLPGILAHESAKRDGEWMEIPDLGESPR